jgi:3-hydroxyacyl-CoA dehydrogenase/3-hydroxy-2-methylbutyryl-CoA dehydrogenase
LGTAVKLEGATVIVVGGASGLGEGVAREVVRRGARVAVLDRDETAGKALVTELSASAVFHHMDITDSGNVERTVTACVTEFGRLDILVNCAGISPAARTVSRNGDLFPLEVFKEVTSVNLVGLFDVTRHVAGHMRRNDAAPSGERGLVVNVSSVAAYEGQVGQVAYSATKAAITGMTLPLARDLAPFGVRVMTVCPGVMNTPMVAGLDEARRQPLLNLSLFPKRLGEPSDFADLVCAIAENEFLNAEVIRLDAGARLA